MFKQSPFHVNETTADVGLSRK